MTWLLPALAAVSGGALLGSPIPALLGTAAGMVLGRLLSICRSRWVRLFLWGALGAASVRLVLPGLPGAILALAAGGGLQPPAVAFTAGLTCVFLTVWMQQGSLGAAAVVLSLAPAFVAAGSSAQVSRPWTGVYSVSLMLLFLTEPLQQHRPHQARRLLRVAVVPCCAAAVLVLCLSGLVPGEQLRQELLSVGEQGVLGIFGSGADMGFLQKRTSVPLGKTPPAGGSVPILEITPRKGGVYYLRGQDYDIFTGKTWESDEARSEEFGGWGEIVDSVNFRLQGTGSYMLLPYYPGAGTNLRGGRVELTLRDYSVDLYAEGSAMAPHLLGAYYRLDDETRAWAVGFAQGASTPAAIADLVQHSAVYDRQTPAMPEEEENFAVWFAETSERGYCTHFATLAVVLLRSAGIPARYVTGFRVEARAGEAASVTADCAHAWAEFYDFADGAWKILECTPAAEAAAGKINVHPNVQVLKICKGLPIFVVFVVYFQSKLRLFLRRRRFRRGSLQRRAWGLYEEGALLSRLLGETPPDYLHDRLQRALYSQAGLQEQELESFRVYCRQCLRRLRRKGFLTRVRHRLHHAAY